MSVLLAETGGECDKFKALDKCSEGVLQFCSLNSTYKSRMQAVFVLGSLCAGKKKKAGNFISIVKSFALSVFFMTGTNEMYFYCDRIKIM